MIHSFEAYYERMIARAQNSKSVIGHASPSTAQHGTGRALTTSGSLNGKVHPLEGIVQKIRRAEEHLRTIGVEVVRHKNECRIGRQQNGTPNLINLIAIFPEPPIMLSVFVGDCLHNLRSALDHLVWQLVEANPPNHGIIRNQFPICRDHAAFQREINGHRLDGVCSKAIAEIEGLQPYNGGQGLPYTSHSLWLLDQLVNIDKHRTLTLTCVTTQNLLGDVTYNVNQSGPVMCSVQSNHADSVQKELESGLCIAFKEPPAEGLDVEIRLRAIIEYVESHLLPRFVGYLA